ncbi:cyclopropane-fatty-acyl-phospholipid synthase family protein [Coraliomargarita algicola]|uniref:Cyclopropane-fatty-acyl-phospholipid synthase family protein n=1 Tax=Coraliomargarita algicola TaxID=3092156 RepID=A0ABZ0RHG5_9BACT|nr:cyclopropane-fatty-acyl-phospholipid synthase family protein [Coraliomargarita sp. J2-16]WPJ94538.1 cyclopropane-fatty-acyl-phospholipid synthase family protein [Coraliomargarita sp. J2-16]
MATTHTSILSQNTGTKASLRLMERVFLRLLQGVRQGSLCIEFPSGSKVVLGDECLPMAHLQVLKSEFFRQVLSGGSVALGEAYVDGLWTTNDLSQLLKLLARNQRQVGRLGQGFSLLARQLNHWYHLARKNTLKQSRENIQAHYDLSNQFYASFLDPTMTYSSACFARRSDTLEQAQLSKIDRMLDLAAVGAGDSILEIGSGWGALAKRAAERGCHVTTITLSEEQLAYAQQLFTASGVSGQIDIQLKDYRNLVGQFDAVISCEMIEAVGKQYLPSYFETIRDCLKPGAKAVLQAITISDDRYAQYCRSCDWIQKHIFPGGHLPSPSAIREHVEQAGELQITQMHAFGSDYAETLRRWADAFNRQQETVRFLGFDEAFCRKWNYYFSYCEAGFDTDLIDVQHVVIEKVQS